MRSRTALADRRQVLAALAQRRHADLDHVQPVVQVLAEAAGLHLGAEVLVRGADDAHVDRLFRVTAPTGRTDRSWIARSSFDCIDSGRSPISSRNSVPPLAAWKKPSRSSLAPVKAPLR